MQSNAASSCFFCDDGVSKDYGNKSQGLSHVNIINAWEERCVVSTCRMLRIPSSHPAVAALLSTQNYCGGCMQVMRDVEFSVGAMDKLQQQILRLRQKLLNKLESKSERLKKLKVLDNQSSPPSTNSTNSPQDLFDFVIQNVQKLVEMTDADFLLKNYSVLSDSWQGIDSQEEERVVEDISIEIEAKVKDEPLGEEDEDALNPAEYLDNESLNIEETRYHNQVNHSAKEDEELATADEPLKTEEGPALNVCEVEINSGVKIKKEYEIVNSGECLDESLIIEEARDFTACDEVDVSIKDEDEDMFSSAEEESDFDTNDEGNNEERTEGEKDTVYTEANSFANSKFEIIVKSEENDEEIDSDAAETDRGDPLEYAMTLPSVNELEPVELKRRLRYARLHKMQIEVRKPAKERKEKTKQKEKLPRIPRERPPKGPWGFNTDKLRKKKRNKGWSTGKRQEALKREARLKKQMEDAKLVVSCPDVNCRQRFESNNKLDIHLRQVHGGIDSKLFSCDKCDKKFGLINALNKHLYWHSLPRNEKPEGNRKPCSFCGILLNPEETEEHEGKHRAREFPFSCLICEDVKFIRASALGKHMMEVHPTEDSKLKKCHCGRQFASSGSLAQHIRRVHEDPSQNHRCKECNKVVYKTAAELKNHMDRRHSVPRDLKRVMCEKCGKIYGDSSRLYEHMKTHNEVLSFKCRFCEKRFHKSQSVKKHEEIHAGLQFQCPDCPKMFSTRRYLSQHSRCHLPRELRKYYYKTKEPTKTESSESHSTPLQPPEIVQTVQLPSQLPTATVTSAQIDGNMELPYCPNLPIANSVTMPVPLNPMPLSSHFPYLN